jgi:hypothetical protein
VELAGDAGLLQVGAQELGGLRLVTRRVDRVESEQVPEERRRLVAQGGDGH